MLDGEAANAAAKEAAPMHGNLTSEWPQGIGVHGYHLGAVFPSWQDDLTRIQDNRLLGVKPSVQLWQSSPLSGKKRYMRTPLDSSHTSNTWTFTAWWPDAYLYTVWYVPRTILHILVECTSYNEDHLTFYLHGTYVTFLEMIILPHM
jgi:hypothetical protein